MTESKSSSGQIACNNLQNCAQVFTYRPRRVTIVFRSQNYVASHFQLLTTKAQKKPENLGKWIFCFSFTSLSALFFYLSFFFYVHPPRPPTYLFSVELQRSLHTQQLIYCAMLIGGQFFIWLRPLILIRFVLPSIFGDFARISSDSPLGRLTKTSACA